MFDLFDWFVERRRAKKLRTEVKQAGRDAEGGMTDEEVKASQQKLFGPATVEGAWEETERLRREVKAAREAAAMEHDPRVQAEKWARRASDESSRWRQYGSQQAPGESDQDYKQRTEGASEAGKQARGGSAPLGGEEILSKFTGRERKRLEERLRQAEKTRAYADVEIIEGAVPEKLKTVQRVWQPGYWTSTETGRPIPEPQTTEEKRKAQYHPAEYKFIEVDKPLSSIERLAASRALRSEGMQLAREEAAFKAWQMEGKLPQRTARAAVGFAKAAGGFGQFVAGAATMGVAGAARGAQPGRGGLQRAAGMHAPSLPLDLYGVRPVLGVGMPTAKSLTGSGLGHLREMALPRMRRRGG